MDEYAIDSTPPFIQQPPDTTGGFFGAPNIPETQMLEPPAGGTVRARSLNLRRPQPVAPDGAGFEKSIQKMPSM
jgi:hypothetical protein